MVPALQPISGFLNLAPIAPVLPRGRGAEQLVPFVGLVMTDASTLVNLGATRALPLTYTASGSFSAALQTVPATGAVGSPFGNPQDGVQRLHMSLDLSLDFELVWGRSAAANAGLTDVRESAFRALSDGVTTDLLLAALSGSSSSSGVDQTLSRLLASDLNTALLTSPVGSIDNAAITTLTGNSGASATLTGELDATATLTLAVTPTTASTASLTTGDTAADTATTGTATTAVLALATPAADTAATPVALTAPTAAGAAAPVVTAVATTTATDAALQRFLTDAAARAHDAVTNNPAYAAAAAALYASAAVFRSQADNAPAASAFAPGSPVTEVTPPRPMDAIPTSLT